MKRVEKNDPKKGEVLQEVVEDQNIKAFLPYGVRTRPAGASEMSSHLASEKRRRAAVLASALQARAFGWRDRMRAP